MALLGISHNILKDARGQSPVRQVRHPHTDALAGYDLDVTLADQCGFDYVVRYLAVDLRFDVRVNVVVDGEEHRWNPSRNLDQAYDALKRLGGVSTNGNGLAVYDALREILTVRVGNTVAVPYLEEPKQ